MWRRWRRRRRGRREHRHCRVDLPNSGGWGALSDIKVTLRIKGDAIGFVDRGRKSRPSISTAQISTIASDCGDDAGRSIYLDDTARADTRNVEVVVAVEGQAKGSSDACLDSL